MKKILTSLLIALVTVAPVLACCCPQDAQSVVQTNADHTNSVHHHDDKDSDENSSDDCTQTYLQVSGQTSVTQALELKNNFQLDPIAFDHAFSGLVAFNLNAPHHTYRIDNPPDHTFPLYLSTQRLRI